jgi:hypothetical protein
LIPKAVLAVDALNRAIAGKRRELDQDMPEIAPAAVEAFAAALQTRLRDPASPAFRRAYLRQMLGEVRVAPDKVRISGQKAALAGQLAANDPLAPSLVRTSVQEWRARRDSSS